LFSLFSKIPALFAANFISLFSIRDYKFLVLSNFFIFAGYQIRVMAIAWIVLDITESEKMMGLINALPGISVITLSLFGGALADRVERWKLLWQTKIVITIMALITGILLTFEILDSSTIWYLIPISLVIGIMFALHNPASQAYVLDVVGKNKLVSATSFSAASSTFATIIAPSMGGLLLWLGYDLSFYVLTLFYFCGALMILSMKTRHKSSDVLGGTSIFLDMKLGLEYAFKNPIIRALLILSITAIFSGIYQPVIPVKIKQDLGLGEFEYGFVLAMNGIGTLIGSIILFVINERIKKIFLIIISFLAFDFGILFFGFSPNFVICSLSMIIMGIGISGWMITIPVLLQTKSSDNMRGRVISLYFMCVLTYQLGWLFGGYFLEYLGINETLIIAVSGSLSLATLTILFSKSLRSVN
tara:strand:- start:147 stop:1394 length:1248 start_codon:yes stop_codon:yes gene_type:complete